MTDLSEAKRALIERRLRGRPPRRRGIPRVDRTGPVHTPSAGQRRMWFLTQLADHGPVHHVPFTMEWPDPVDAGRLSRCLTEIVRRHEVLRAGFEVRDGELVVVVAADVVVDVPVTDLAAESDLPAAVRRVATAPFDLATPPLLRAEVLRVHGRADTVAVTIHHIAADGWSMGVLADELATLYRGEEPPDLPIQYLDHAAWLARADVTAELAHWTRVLADAPEPAAVPPDRPHQAVRGHLGRTLRLDLDPALLDAVRAAARGGTTFPVVVAAVAVVLGRHARTDDVLFGTATAGRDEPETAGLIGFFVNTVPLRLDLADDPTLADVLESARGACLDAVANQRLPFDRLVEHLSPRRDPAGVPYVRTMVVHQDSGTVAGGDLPVHGVDLGIAPFDLTVTYDEDQAGAALRFEYDTDRYDAETISDVRDHVEQVLHALADRPGLRLGELDLLPPPRVRDAPAPPPPPRPPRHTGELAHRITGIWADVLGVAVPDPHTTFFDVGGNSLLLVEVRSRLHADLGVTPSLLDLYTYPTAAGLAAHLAGNPA